MSRGPDAGTLLRRALERDAHRAGCAATIADTHLTRWASATFIGAQHRLAVLAPMSGALDAWLATLPEAEFVLHGHLLADITVASIDRAGDAATIVLEALTVET